MCERENLVVVKANSLIEASYKLTLDEARIIALTVGKLDPNSDQREFEFTIADVVKEFPDLKIENTYKQIKAAITNLSERWVKTQDDDELVSEFRWVSSKTYFKREGRFRIILTPEVMPYLTQLKGQFTKYQLKNISGFTSSHAIRIYELLAQYTKVGEREITIDNLKKWLQIEDKYKRYNSLNERVISPAIKEINDKSNLLVEYETITEGRKVVALKFKINQKDNDVIMSKESNNVIEEKNTNKYIIMSQLQLEMFGDKLVKSGLIDDLANAGEKTKDFTQRIKQMLKDPEKQYTLHPALKEVGFYQN